MNRWIAAGAIALVAQTVTAQSIHGPAQQQRLDELSSGLIVKYRQSAAVTVASAKSASRVQSLAARAGVKLRPADAVSDQSFHYQFDKLMNLAEARAAAARLQQDPAVEYAEPNVYMRAMQAAAPNDPKWSQQWHYGTGPGGANLLAAWARTRGSSSVVVAVVDSGIRPNHPDLQGARLLTGYDMVSEDLSLASVFGVSPYWFTADGNGRDSDPTDPGTYVTSAEISALPLSFVNAVGLVPQPSSWHGTHVAGTIAATTDNGVGVAGIAPNVKLLPVRALGKSGSGTLADITAAIRWAAGLSVPGAPDNPNPARVINLSLGGSGACGPTYQDAIDAVRAVGAIVVASTGNDSTIVGRPANCNGVIAVMAHAINGEPAGYTNSGVQTAISAPGGGCPFLSYNPSTYACSASAADREEVWSTYNLGSTVATTDDYGAISGTSMAAPHVSGAVALMLSIAPQLVADEVKAVLQSSAKPFPSNNVCSLSGNAGLCGAGMLDIGAAVQAVVNGLPGVTAVGPGIIGPATTVQLIGTAVPRGTRTIASTQWAQVSGPSTLNIQNPTALQATLVTPATGTFVVRFTARDSRGYESSVTETFRVNSAPVMQPIAPQTVTVGQSVTVTAVATDADGDAVSYVPSIGSLPGATFNATTGVLTWTPQTAGTYTYTVAATDGTATGASVAATITVQAPPPPPAASSGGGGGGSLALGWLLLLAAGVIVAAAARGASRRS